MSHSSISPQDLAPLIGTRRTPCIVDVRSDDEFGRNPLLIPGSVRRAPATVQTWGPEFADRTVVVSCGDGGGVSQGTSAWLRDAGIPALALDGGFATWQSHGNLLTNAAAIPPSRDVNGRTVWVTRERPKFDRIACPWLIRRFVDPRAAFLFVEASQVASVAAHFDATPFDIEGVFWSHRGETCSFDTMLFEFELGSAALDRLALIVRAADTARLDLVP